MFRRGLPGAVLGVAALALPGCSNLTTYPGVDSITPRSLQVDVGVPLAECPPGTNCTEWTRPNQAVVRPGMTADQVVAIMGSPNETAVGVLSRFAASFPGEYSRTRTAVWAWFDAGGHWVAFLDEGVVSHLGFLPPQ